MHIALCRGWNRLTAVLPFDSPDKGYTDNFHAVAATVVSFLILMFDMTHKTMNIKVLFFFLAYGLNKLKQKCIPKETDQGYCELDVLATSDGDTLLQSIN